MLAWVGCQDTRSIATPKPTPQMAEVSGKPYAALKKGHEIYQEKCSQCHVHRLPSTAGLPDWHRKVKSMATKAQLSSEDEKFLQVYLDEFSDR
jgi:cytochrome c5